TRCSSTADVRESNSQPDPAISAATTPASTVSSSAQTLLVSRANASSSPPTITGRMQSSASNDVAAAIPSVIAATVHPGSGSPVDAVGGTSRNPMATMVPVMAGGIC